MIWFSIPMIILYAILFGITMKIADLHDEHKLKYFKGSAILFGFLLGGFGTLLVLSNVLIANIMLAMTLASIIRNRLDYINLQIAGTTIIISFIASSIFMPILFTVFFAIFLIFGSVRDYIGDKIKKKNKLQSIYDDVMWYYSIPTLIYCLIYGNWIIFGAFLVYEIAYDLTKYIYKKKGYP